MVGCTDVSSEGHAASVNRGDVSIPVTELHKRHHIIEDSNLLQTQIIRGRRRPSNIWVNTL